MLENIQKHICMRSQLLSYKLRKIKDWLNLHNDWNKVAQNLGNKLLVTFFKGLFKLENTPG